MEYESDGDTNCNRCTCYSHERIGKDTEGYGKKDEGRTSKLQHSWDRLEYLEESYRLDEICCHSNASGKPSVNAGIKNN